MIEDAWDDGAQLQADVCVVGAGASGLALAHGLAPARPRVVLLESGGVRRGDEHDDLNRGESAAAPLEGSRG